MSSRGVLRFSVKVRPHCLQRKRWEPFSVLSEFSCSDFAIVTSHSTLTFPRRKADTVYVADRMALVMRLVGPARSANFWQGI